MNNEQTKEKKPVENEREITKLGVTRSVFSMLLAVLVIFGSVMTVAAAANGNGASDAEKSPAQLAEILKDNTARVYDIHITDGRDIDLNVVSGGTVAGVLEQFSIEVGKEQLVDPAPETIINGATEIRILDAKKIKLTADGETTELLLPYGVVAESLALAGVKLGKDDILSVERNEQVKNIDKLTIRRVTYKNVTTSKKISYDCVTENSDEVELGETKLKTKGVEGEKAVVSRVKYIDGKKDSSEVVAEKVIRKPVDEVTLVGAKGAGSTGGEGSFTDSNGVEVSYKYMLSGSGTAYTAPAGSLTATGNTVYVGGVAVNPDLIPYGSKLYIESVDGSFVYGYATAIDTGGALMDGSAIVDCFYFTYDECCNFGRRDVNVYVIE